MKTSPDSQTKNSNLKKKPSQGLKENKFLSF
jgi:hypothetical protein